MDKKLVLIMFGGNSAEHEVSIISGLQIVEKIDRERYEPHVVFVTQKGEYHYCGNIAGRKDFMGAKRTPAMFGADEKGGFLKIDGLMGKKLYPYAAYFAFHGGTGESGPLQGVCDAVGIPHTGPRTEGSVIAMNKRLTNQVLASAGVQAVEGVAVFSDEVEKDSLGSVRRVLGTLSLPVIVKPVHLGSSIAISIARTEADLERALIEASRVDSEVLVERLLSDFTEYNCSVRTKDGKLEVSEIERPVSKDEILSFADKYQRGGKKQGGQSGMASLDRELPAKIEPELRTTIEGMIKAAYRACRLQGVVRIDCMYERATKKVYITEVNPIPGSLAFYLWEAKGIPFKTQITDSLEECVHEAGVVAGRHMEYKTDIVEKFCA